MTNEANYYVKLQQKINKDMKELQSRINTFKTRIRWHARHYSELKEPSVTTGRIPSRAEINRLNAEYESIKKYTNKKINEYNAKMKMLEKRYNANKKNSIIRLAMRSISDKRNNNK